MSASGDKLAAALADRYRIDRELGQGGMATVYLAEDLRHQRKVAIKVLRPELAAIIGAGRFLREITTIAQLQHPHILGLIDSGEIEGTAYYVMPFVEGESLRDRLSREKQLPIQDGVRIASEVAAALDYAHRHGIIHRDIKPENILLHDGSALVADFGIALAISSAGGARMTETGLSLGTPHYMSPEQAMGEREITARSDVYALGAMTYEMLVGEPPFTGPTAQAIVAKVIANDPAPPSQARRNIPPNVEEAILTALEKLPADRFATAAEFAAALAPQPGRLTAERRAMLADQTSSATRTRPGGVVLAAVGVGILAAGYFVGRATAGAREHPTPTRLAIIAPTLGGSGGSALSRQLAITPAGDAVVYVGLNPSGNTVKLLYQPLDAAEPSEIPGTPDAWGPDISRDGHWMIASNQGQSFRLPLRGGTPARIPVRLGLSNAAWGPDGSYWFTDANVAGIVRLSQDDSVTALDRGRTSGLRMQQVLSDGRTALVTRAASGTVSGPVLFLDLQSGDTSPFVDGPVIEARLVGGELLAVLPDGSLTATPVDVGRRRVTGAPTQIASGVSLTGTGIAQFAAADNGTLAYIPESPRSLVFMDRNGAARQAIEERLNVHAPHFSPDGRRLSLDITSADGRDVWILSLGQNTLTRATFDKDGHDATWTPDGRFITYAHFKDGTFGLYRVRPGGGEPAESLLVSNHLAYPGSWLHDMSALVTTANELHPESNVDIGIVRNGGHGPIEPLVATQFQEQYPALSPDDRWLAFVSDQSGRQEVYVRRLTGESDLVQVSQDGGNEPVWGPDGREIFYRSTRESEVVLMDAMVRTTPAFEVTARRPLFPITEMVGTSPHANYDISPDGRTFAFVRRSPSTHIVVIQNLPELLRRIRGNAGRSP